MHELADRFRRAGCTRWVLNVKPDNLPAIRLYRSVGMSEKYLSTALRIEWSAVRELPGPARDVLGRLADPAEDAALESAFGLAQGLLAGARKDLGRVIVRLVDVATPDDGRVGVASFDPHFPGAFPFKVAEPGLARALFEAMKPHALPEHSYVGMVVEDDAALTRLLLDHGAEVRLQIVHYEGTL